VNLTVAITGASGAILSRELLRALETDERVSGIDFVASENSLRVIAEELGISGRTGLIEKLLGATSIRVRMPWPSRGAAGQEPIRPDVGELGLAS
ncbi:MAG TPA: flavoprotein, partial [Casimicrobiaceae bacterium]|nr:flavoprotein [Casimicrobiaceae bacterium]